MLPLRYIAGCIITVSVLFSCGKKESYDIKGDPEVKFFTNVESSGNAPQNSFSFVVVNHPDPAGSGLLNLSGTIPSEIKFPVLATKAVSQSVGVTAQLDNSLIEQYNAAHNTNYAAFPAGFLTGANLTAQIPGGATRSADSITIAADLASLGSLTESAYMAPVKLTSVSNPSAGAITGNSAAQVVYIVVTVSIQQIKFNAGAAEAVGVLINPRSAWNVALTPDPSPSGSIIDGSNSSYSRWGSTTQGLVDVDMQASQNVTGLRLFTTTTSNQTPTQVTVYLSPDGINYENIGAPLRANLSYGSGYTYILFYKAIQARYIRLQLNYGTSTNTQNRRIAELDVYAN